MCSSQMQKVDQQYEWLKEIAFKEKQSRSLNNGPFDATCLNDDSLLITGIDIIGINEKYKMGISKRYRKLDDSECLFLNFKILGIEFIYLAYKGEKEWDHFMN